MKNIPYGKTNYRDLVESDCIYIDKTMYLEKLEKDNNTIIYLRPRRFGKTLFASMMYYYYDIKSKYLYDKLFKHTYIYTHPTKNKNSYYMLRFDFSRLNEAQNEKELKEKFNLSVKSSIERFLIYYNLNINVDYSLDASDMIDNLFIHLDENHPVYVIIDEYDSFTNKLLKENAKTFIKILGKDGFVRDFYATLKLYNGDIVKKTFITGVCSISLDSMTSGYNIGTNITNNINYNAMTGITHEELHKLLDYLNIKDDVFNIMEENYDGYKFNEDTSEKVFNPNLVMYFLNNYMENMTIPKKLLDSNIYSDYNQIKNLVSLFNNNIHKNVINQILENKCITGILEENFNLNMNTFNGNFIISLLYYFGYLTIGNNIVGVKEMLFKIPNKVMESVFNDYFVNILKEHNIQIDNSKDIEILKNMDNGNIDLLNEKVSKLIKECSNRIFENFKEKDIELIYFTAMQNIDAYKTYTEYELNGGYADLMMRGKYDYMIEFKYIKKSDYSDKLLNKKLEEAKNQLITYSKDERLDKDKLKRFIIIYVGNDLKKVEMI